MKCATIIFWVALTISIGGMFLSVPAKAESSSYTFLVPGDVVVDKTGKVNISIGLKGAQDVPGSKIKTVFFSVSELPGNIKNCNGETDLVNWNVTNGSLANGKFDFFVRTESSEDYIKSTVEKIATLSCDLGTDVQVGKAPKLKLVGKLAADNNQTYSIEAPQERAFNIKGKVIGNGSDGVAMSCGTLRTTTNEFGEYTFFGIKDSTCCVITPQKEKFIFTPSVKSICITGSDVVDLVFNSAPFEANASQASSAIGSSTKSTDIAANNKPSSVATRIYGTPVSPSAGPSSLLVITASFILGILGAWLFIGKKMNWL